MFILELKQGFIEKKKLHSHCQLIGVYLSSLFEIINVWVVILGSVCVSLDWLKG